jgi:hypothetical protein
MAWNEVAAKRKSRSRVYQDSENPNKFRWSGRQFIVNYESTTDSGVFDQGVDLAPTLVNNAQLSGWRMTNNEWHYALGQPGDKTTDGWVGFGGRQGQNWLKFRLAKVGYLHWPTRAWQDVGGNPTYTRANLDQQTLTSTLPDGTSVSRLSTIDWSAIWTFPGGATVDIKWRILGHELKEDVVVNQAMRDWVKNNAPPTTSVTETFFGFVYELDVSDVPKFVKNGLEQDIDGDFSDVDGAIEIKDSLDRLLGFMPITNVYVPMTKGQAQAQGLTAEDISRTLRKRIWKEGDNYYLLVGVRVDYLNQLPDGDLVFDPTWGGPTQWPDEDAVEGWGGAVSLTGIFGNLLYLTGSGDGGGEFDCWQYDNVTMSGTIDTTSAMIIDNGGDNSDPQNIAWTLRAEDTLTPATIVADDNDISSRTTLTTASETGVGQAGTLTITGSDFAGVLQELVNSYTYDGNDTISLIATTATAGTDWWSIGYDVSHATGDPASLEIDYTVVGVGLASMRQLVGHGQGTR